MNKTRTVIGFRDIVLIALLTVLSIVIQLVTAIPFAAVPQLMMFVSVALIMLLCGPIYVLIMAKAPRRGAAFLFAGLMALYFIILGQVFISISYLICALLCECVLLGDGYKKPLRITFAYMIFAAFYVLGSFLPYLVLAEQYTQQLLASGVAQASITDMMRWFTSPVMLLLAALNACVFAALGSFLGFKMLKKHFRPAGAA
ncbi:MAG: MptD family putative ECF transporter S component [Lachnospiraceae bacterium]